jgi:hypothetical protein
MIFARNTKIWMSKLSLNFDLHIRESFFSREIAGGEFNVVHAHYS